MKEKYYLQGGEGSVPLLKSKIQKEAGLRNSLSFCHRSAQYWVMAEQKAPTQLSAQQSALYGPLTQRFLLEIGRWAVFDLLSQHYIIVDFLAHQLASNLLVFIICLKLEERKRIIYISWFKARAYSSLPAHRFIKMINECIVTEP